MWAAVGVFSLLAIILSILGTIFVAIKHTGTWKKWLIGAGVSFIVFIIAVINTPHSKQQSQNQPDQVTTTNQQRSDSQQNEPQVKEKEIVPFMDTAEIERFKSYTLNIRGASFISSAEISGDTAIISYGDYADHLKLHPRSSLKEKDYIEYWGTGDAINKALMEEPIRLLREFTTLEKVNMALPFQGKKYNTQVDRKTIENYLNVNLAEIHKDATNEQWREKIASKYFNNEERSKYVKQFVTTN